MLLVFFTVTYHSIHWNLIEICLKIASKNLFRNFDPMP